MCGRMGGMEPVQAGDWVRTNEGHEGKIVLLGRLSAFVEIKESDLKRTRSFLLSDLTKIWPSQMNTGAEGEGHNPPSATNQRNVEAKLSGQ